MEEERGFPSKGRPLTRLIVTMFESLTFTREEGDGVGAGEGEVPGDDPQRSAAL